MHGTRSIFLVGLLAVLAHMACAVGEVQNAALIAAGFSSCDTTYLADIESDFAAQVDLATPGGSPQILFDAYIPGSTTKILQTYQLTITLPAAFGFNGFGAAGASVGQLDFNFGSDHIFDQSDYTIPHRAIDANNAYADSLKNGVYDAGIDATATHTIGQGGAHVFTITLPSGGTSYGGRLLVLRHEHAFHAARGHRGAARSSGPLRRRVRRALGRSRYRRPDRQRRAAADRLQPDRDRPRAGAGVPPGLARGGGVARRAA